MARHRKDIRFSRTSMSCERCRGRKTKCKNPVPGPCDYCRGINAECRIDPDKRRQRPYYFVSEEEFRNMQIILKHYIPDTDLTPDNLRSLALRSQTTMNRASEPVELNALSPPITAVFNEAGETEPSSEFTYGAIFPYSSEEETEDNILQQVLSLYHKLGCLLEDSQGQYRYMGAESGLPFNTAIRCFKRDGLQTPLSPDVIPAMVTVTMPLPLSPPDSKGISLPSWETCLELVTKYFEEVHCLYWLYSSERFHAQLEETYHVSQEMVTASWRCALCSILAIAKLGSDGPGDSYESMTAKDYLENAKSLVSGACDEGSLESVRSMVLLATAMQSHGFSNPAHLYSSLAVQIACSLGIHCDKYSATYGSVEREHSRRIWWSVITFDQDLSLRIGKPSATESNWNFPPLPSETILPSGSYSPPGYLAACSTLGQLGRNIRTKLYREPLLPEYHPKMKMVMGLVVSLQDWADSIPSHLNISAPTAPLHRRAISVLHLRYHSMRLLIGRPFLLYRLLCWKKQQNTESHPSLSQFTDICTSSAEKMLEIMQIMVADEFHSSIIALDFYYALDILQIFICAFAISKAEKQFDNIRKCLRVLQSLSTTGFGEMMISEVLFELTEWGLFPDCADPLDSLQGFDASLLSVDAVNDFHDRIFGDCNMDFDLAWSNIIPQFDLTEQMTGNTIVQDDRC